MPWSGRSGQGRKTPWKATEKPARNHAGDCTTVDGHDLLGKHEFPLRRDVRLHETGKRTASVTAQILALKAGADSIFYGDTPALLHTGKSRPRCGGP